MGSDTMKLRILGLHTIGSLEINLAAAAVISSPGPLSILVL